MQAFFIIGLFALVYTLVAGLTTGISLTTMLYQQDKVKQVETIFQNFEEAVIKGVAEVSTSLVGVDTSDMTFALEYMNWTENQVLVDPWRVSYTIIVASRTETIYADLGIDAGNPADNNFVVAPVFAIALVSFGPDRISQTTVGGTGFLDIQAIEADDDSDDIVHVFTTRASVQNTWARTKANYNLLASAIREDYRSQYEAFRPWLLEAQAAGDPLGRWAIINASDVGTIDAADWHLSDRALAKLQYRNPNGLPAPTNPWAEFAWCGEAPEPDNPLGPPFLNPPAVDRETESCDYPRMAESTSELSLEAAEENFPNFNLGFAIYPYNPYPADRDTVSETLVTGLANKIVEISTTSLGWNIFYATHIDGESLYY